MVKSLHSLLNNNSSVSTPSKKVNVNLGVDENDIELKNTDYYPIVMNIIGCLDETGVLVGSSGKCLAVSDLLQKSLLAEGIESTLLECELSVLDKDNKQLYMVGYDRTKEYNLKDKLELHSPTHIVIVTDTDIPILIDLSISHIDQKVKFICMRLNTNSKVPCISEFKIGSSTWTYYEKENKIVTLLHEQSILNRIKKDRSVDKNINNIFKLMIILGTITSLNFARGIFDFYQKYINKTNGFGPVHAERVIK